MNSFLNVRNEPFMVDTRKNTAFVSEKEQSKKESGATLELMQLFDGFIMCDFELY